MLLLARLVRTLANIVAAIIMIGVLLYVLEANEGNVIVSAVLDAGRWLVGPFDGMFSLDDRKWERAVNWGIAAAVWAIAGAIIARLLTAAGSAGRGRRRRGFGFGRRRPAA